MLNNIIWEVEYWFKVNILSNIKSFFYNIKNIWVYRKIVWNDRWWDHSFLTEMIVFKLQTMIDNWDDAHYIGSDFTKKRMIIIRKRIEEYSDKIDELQYEYIVNKKYSKEEYRQELRKLNDKTWGTFGRNLGRFWD